MTFSCTTTRTRDGQWTIRHSGASTGTIEVTAATREQALEKMRSELRYVLELCPCTGEQYKDLHVELIEQQGTS